MRNKILHVCLLFLVLALLSCGGGSTVTAVSLEADNTDVALGGSTSLTAKSEQSITENVTGEKVRFSFRVNESGGRLDVVNERLDGNGQAKAIFHAGTRAGYDIVQAAFDSGATATVTIRVGTGLPVAPLEVTQIGTNTVRVRVTDPRGIPIEGAMVNLSISVGTITPTSGTTDVNGIVEATFTLPAGVTSARVTATVQGQTATATVSTADTSVASIQLSQRGTTLEADGSVVVQVHSRALDRSNRPVSGVQINFSIRGAGAVNPAHGMTDTNGILMASVTMPAGVNSTQLVAVSGNVTQTLTIRREAQGVIQLVQYASTVQARVLDSSGSPMSGALVNFAMSQGTVKPPVGTTDSNGIVTVEFELPDGVNSALLTAISGVIEASLTVQRPQTQLRTIRLEQFGWRIMATALDATGTPLPGILINFRITTGTITATATTNNNGVAEAEFTLPDGVNSARVMASSGTVSNTLDVTRPTRSGSQESSVLKLDDDVLNAASIRIEQAGQKVRVQLKDAEGQGIPWALLQFTMNPGTVDPVSLYTNADGSAETTFALPESAAQGEITAEGGGATASLIVR